MAFPVSTTISTILFKSTIQEFLQERAFRH